MADLFDVLNDVRHGKYKRTMMSTEESGAGKNKLVDTNNTKGKVLIRDGVIVFDKVPIVTPNSDILVNSKYIFNVIMANLLWIAQGSFVQSQYRNELFNFRS